MPEAEARLVRVTGRVQGVGFRAWTAAEAGRLGLRGWVRNDPDGGVTALVAGPAAAVAAMTEALRRGPPGAVVASLVWQPADPGPDLADFRIPR